MTRQIHRVVVSVACALALWLGLPGASQAQSTSPAVVSPEVFGSIGYTHLANCCRVFGDNPIVGGGLGIRWRRLGVEVEANRVLGLSPRSLPCAIQYGQTCLPGRQGAESATLALVNADFVLMRTRIQPYVTGGAGLLWSTQIEPELNEQFSGIPNTPPIAVTLVERENHDRGFAINFGGGVRVPVTSSIALRPEVRIYDATLLSSYNMGLVRVSMQVTDRW